MYEESDINELFLDITGDLRKGRARTPDEAVENRRRRTPEDLIPALEEAGRRANEEQKRIGSMRQPRTLADERGQRWYTGPDPEEDFIWWAYREHLQTEKQLPSKAIEDIDRSTTRTLSLMSPPGLGAFSTRGLVLGYVQSGKTANYVGLMAKAADAGYRFFIVLTGMIETLRRQTQERIEEDLVSLREEQWVQLAQQYEDFKNRGNVNVFLDENHGLNVIAVVKKNKSVLEKLINWIQGASSEKLRSVPVMVIDDEADQASIDTTRGDDERSRINDQILQILGSFPKVAYVGYTATPFANVLIDPSVPQDLYPSDFIVDLPRPDDYLGPEDIFGREPLTPEEAENGIDGLDMIREVEAEEASHLAPGRNEVADFAPEIQPSLRTATLYFWLATAARRARGQTKDKDHSTMLVHTSQLADVHEATRPLLQQIQQDGEDRMKGGDSAFIDELRTLWEEEAHAVPPQKPEENSLTFGQIEGYLPDIISQTQVICENHKSSDRIDYRQPRQVIIAIGGNVLSRGLTLEGLIVSYFARHAASYDTLLQMGRWFGFRPGYSDLPRIWMTPTLRQQFRDLATVEEELRQDTQRSEEEGLTPRDFAVRIRKHPVLNITSPEKMRAAVHVQRSYEGRRLQTILFRQNDPDWLRENIEATRRLVGQASSQTDPVETDYGWVFKGIDHEKIIDFIAKYNFHERSRDLDSDLLHRYIEAQYRERGHLGSWNLVVMSRKRKEEDLGAIDLGLPGEVPLINRARMEYSPAEGVANIKALMSRPDVIADFPEEYGRSPGESAADLIEWRSRQAEGVGCLLVYPVSRHSTPRGRGGRPSYRLPLETRDHVMGVGMVFPSVPGGADTPQDYTYVAAPLEPEEPIEDPEETP